MSKFDDYFNKHVFHLFGTRASGKTTGAIFSMDLYDVKTMVMMCPEYGRLKLKEYGIEREDLQFISYKQFIEQGCKCDTNFFIDDIDNFMLCLCNNYRGCTLSTRDLG